MTPAGIETATFRFVAQHLNHCATAVPGSVNYSIYISVVQCIYSWSNTRKANISVKFTEWHRLRNYEHVHWLPRSSSYRTCSILISHFELQTWQPDMFVVLLFPREKYSTWQHVKLEQDLLRSQFQLHIHWSTQLVEALRYKPESLGFDSRWRHWNFSLSKSFRPHSARNISCVGLANLPPIDMKSGSLNHLERSGSVQACNGIAVPLSLVIH